MMKDQPREFDCCECGHHIVAIVDVHPNDNLCAHCMTMPGWFRDPGLRAVIDPGHTGREVCERQSQRKAP